MTTSADEPAQVHVGIPRLDGSRNGAPPADTSPAVRVRVRGLWKVFGPRPRDILQSPWRDKARGEVLEATGHVVAVRDVNLDVYEGETFVVMGLSGSGKSTLIRCLIRLIEPSEGSIHISGQDVRSLSPRDLNRFRYRVGMVFQHFGLLPHRNVLQNVTWGLEVQGRPRREREEIGRDMLRLVGLEGWEHHAIDQLSGGMQQRVGLARALAVDPEILLMDEPFSALDPVIRRELQGELQQLQARLRKTIIFITHDLHEAIKLGDRIAIMKDGEIVQVGTPEDIIHRPSNDYVRSFTGDVPGMAAALEARTPAAEAAGTSSRGTGSGKGAPAAGVRPGLLPHPRLTWQGQVKA